MPKNAPSNHLFQSTRRIHGKENYCQILSIFTIKKIANNVIDGRLKLCYENFKNCNVNDFILSIHDFMY